MPPQSLALEGSEDAARAPSAGDVARSAHTERRDLRIASYRALAERSAQLARDIDLPQVREKHALAAKSWLQLADLETPAPRPEPRKRT